MLVRPVGLIFQFKFEARSNEDASHDHLVVGTLKLCPVLKTTDETLLKFNVVFEQV